LGQKPSKTGVLPPKKCQNRLKRGQKKEKYYLEDSPYGSNFIQKWVKIAVFCEKKGKKGCFKLD